MSHDERWFTRFKEATKAEVGRSDSQRPTILDPQQKAGNETTEEVAAVHYNQFRWCCQALDYEQYVTRRIDLG